MAMTSISNAESLLLDYVISGEEFGDGVDIRGTATIAIFQHRRSNGVF